MSDDLIRRLRDPVHENAGATWIETKYLHEAADELEAARDNVDGLQAALVACEQACWKEGQTVEGLNKAIRRAVRRFLDGKNPAQQWIERAEAAEAQAERLAGALAECFVTLKHAHIFVTSRERIKRPEGESLYNGACNQAKTALDLYSEWKHGQG